MPPQPSSSSSSNILLLLSLFQTLSAMPNPIPPSSSASIRSSSSSSWKRWISSLRKRSQNPDLTEESLEEFNRKIEAADAKKSYGANPSPYYRGLTDSRLYLNRMRTAGRSPGRESHVTAKTTSSFSTILIKVFRPSCFKSKRDSNANAKGCPAPTLTPSHQSPSPSLNARVSVSIESGTDGGKSRILNEMGSMKGGERKSSKEGKPMRERIAATSAVGVGVGVQDKIEKESSALMKGKEKEEFVWAIKYRPKTLKDFICNRDKAELLHDLAARGEYNHFIFEGPPGVGKRTMILAFLREAFGRENLETRDVLKEFDLKGEAVPRIKVKMKSSMQHIEVNLSELYGYEKHVIMALVEQCDHTNCRVIVLYEADKLSADTQHYIRWIVERYKSCSKILFCCSDASKLQPIGSICTLIQLLPPSNHEIIEVLEYIAEQEGIELPPGMAERITKNSKQNLRQAIRSFEASWRLNYPFKEDQVIMTGWEDDIANIAKNIIKEQSPKQLYIIRGKLQSLIEHDVSPEFIFSTLVEELKKRLDDHFKSKIDALYLEYNPDTGFPLEDEKSFGLCRRPEQLGKRHNDPVRKNVHHFMRIEEFTAKFMSSYKICVKNFGGSGYEI